MFQQNSNDSAILAQFATTFTEQDAASFAASIEASALPPGVGATLFSNILNLPFERFFKPLHKLAGQLLFYCTEEISEPLERRHDLDIKIADFRIWQRSGSVKPPPEPPKPKPAMGPLYVTGRIPTATAAEHPLLKPMLAEVAAGRTVFLLSPNSKLPLKGSHGYKDATNDAKEIKKHCALHPEATAYGVVYTDDEICIDKDPRHYPAGRDVGAELEEYNLPPTRTIKTPNGEHCEYKKDVALKPKKKQKLFPGIDFIGDKDYSVGPGSSINGKLYTLVNDIELTPLPETFAAVLEVKTEQIKIEGDDFIDDSQQNQDTGKEIIESYGTIINGTRDNATVLMSNQLGDTGISKDVAEDLVIQNAKYQGNFSKAQILKCVRSAYYTRQNPIGCRHPDFVAAERENTLTQIADAITITTTNAVDTAQPNTSNNGAVPKHYAPTDDGTAQRFADRYGDLVKWIKGDKDFYVYKEGKYSRDNLEVPQKCAVKIAALMFAAAGADRAAQKHAARAASATGVRATLELVKHKVAVTVDRFNPDPYLLNVKNGIIDLSQDEPILLAHSPQRFMTRQCPVVYEPNATAPRFTRFLNEIFEGKIQLIECVQRVLGYSLTGDVKTHKIIMHVGSGRNGKGVLLGVVMYVMGEYALTVDPSLLLHKQRSTSSEDEYQLMGTRLALIAESAQGMKINIEKLKRLTGGDWINACMKYGHLVAFPPSHKLHLVTNYPPSLDDISYAVRNRLLVIPYNVRYEPDDGTGKQAHIIDEDLPNKLKAEASGILNWIIQGAIKYRMFGLLESDEVTSATADYINSEDALHNFIEECCYQNEAATVQKSRLYSAYLNWDERKGSSNPELTKKTFPQRMKQKDFKDMRTSNGEFWRGIGLLENNPNAAAEVAFSPPPEIKTVRDYL